MNWTPTKDRLPPEGVIVETMYPSGSVQQLVRRGNMWFLPDLSMYVYATVVYWREVPK